MKKKNITYGIIKPFKPQKIKTTRIRFNFDTDKDGVPDWKDCRPFNPKKQHISKTMKKRIKKLPIVASPTSISGEAYQMWKRMEHKIDRDAPDMIAEVAPHMHSGQLPHVLSKEAKRQAPVARQLFLSTVKKYPGIVSEIERAKPKKVVVTSAQQPDKYMPVGWVSPTGEAYIGPQTPYYSKAHHKKLAQTAYHELKHVEQLKQTPIKKVMNQYPQSGPNPMIDKVTKEEAEKLAEQHYQVPVEQEAIEHSEEKMKEYHKGRTPSGKAISKTLMLNEENNEENDENEET